MEFVEEATLEQTIKNTIWLKKDEPFRANIFKHDNKLVLKRPLEKGEPFDDNAQYHLEYIGGYIHLSGNFAFPTTITFDREINLDRNITIMDPILFDDKVLMPFIEGADLAHTYIKNLTPVDESREALVDGLLDSYDLIKDGVLKLRGNAEIQKATVIVDNTLIEFDTQQGNRLFKTVDGLSKTNKKLKHLKARTLYNILDELPKDTFRAFNELIIKTPSHPNLEGPDFYDPFLDAKLSFVSECVPMQDTLVALTEIDPLTIYFEKNFKNELVALRPNILVQANKINDNNPLDQITDIFEAFYPFQISNQKNILYTSGVIQDALEHRIKVTKQMPQFYRITNAGEVINSNEGESYEEEDMFSAIVDMQNVNFSTRFVVDPEKILSHLELPQYERIFQVLPKEPFENVIKEVENDKDALTVYMNEAFKFYAKPLKKDGIVLASDFEPLLADKSYALSGWIEEYLGKYITYFKRFEMIVGPGIIVKEDDQIYCVNTTRETDNILENLQEGVELQEFFHEITELGMPVILNLLILQGPYHLNWYKSPDYKDLKHLCTMPATYVDHINYTGIYNEAKVKVHHDLRQGQTVAGIMLPREEMEKKLLQELLPKII